MRNLNDRTIFATALKQALDEAFDPEDPTGYFAKKNIHRELELKINRCMLFIRSARCRGLISKLKTAGIDVKINVAGRNKIYFRVELDNEFYPGADRTVYSFVINHYNHQPDPFIPAISGPLAHIRKIIHEDNPQGIKMLEEIVSGIKQN